MCFAGGIILGGALSHLFPNAVDAWETYFAQSNPDFSAASYPFASLLSGFVLLTLIVIDKSLVSQGMEGDAGHNHMVINVPHDTKHDHGHGHSHGHKKKGHKHGHSHGHAHSHTTRPQTSDSGVVRRPSAGSDVVVPIEGDSESTEASRLLRQQEKPALPSDQELLKAQAAEDAAAEASERRANMMQAWIFFVALSIHSVFDGLGVGAETNFSGFYALMVAVLSHKCLDGFALGVPVFFAELPTWQTLFALIFCAAMTPLGVGIGIAATESAHGTSTLLSKAIILSMSAGSFMFISLIELIPSGLEKYGLVWAKLTAVVAGWAIMALIALWV
eukprot:TRINITY_DN11676_c0_g1_i1.p1 TRINITY_DN11676_c0_g1~~TRINITY_DN11676_c0_g1_i1.p1  ORF type:complete len:388 (+),score=53.17 TRINITY_DN11676_c0_g1_i1:170-1165(+)